MELAAPSFKVPSETKTLKQLQFRTSRSTELLTPPSGPLLGYPLLGVSSLIHSVTVEPGTSPAMVSACVSRCMLKVNTAAIRLLTLDFIITEQILHL